MCTLLLRTFPAYTRAAMNVSNLHFDSQIIVRPSCHSFGSNESPLGRPRFQENTRVDGPNCNTTRLILFFNWWALLSSCRLDIDISRSIAAPPLSSEGLPPQVLSAFDQQVRPLISVSKVNLIDHRRIDRRALSFRSYPSLFLKITIIIIIVISELVFTEFYNTPHLSASRQD